MSPNTAEPSSYREALEEFILLWGQMGTTWGINKTMAQIHALLYAEEDPLDTDTIMDYLNISRGNANMNLRNLMRWQLIHKVHFKGERKNFYTADKDVWSIVAAIARERQEREVEPIRKKLEKTLQGFEENENLTDKELAFKERIENFVRFLEMFERFMEALLPYINKKNIKFLKQVVKLAEMKETIKGRFNETEKQKEGE